MEKVNILKKKKGFIFSIIVIILLLVIISMFIFGKNNSETQEKINQEVVSESDSGVINYDNLDNSKIIGDNKVNISSQIKKDHSIISVATERVISNIVAKDAKLFSEGNSGVKFQVTIQNNRTTAFLPCSLVFSFYRKDGSALWEFTEVIDEIPVGGSIEVEYMDSLDFVNAYDYEVKIEQNVNIN